MVVRGENGGRKLFENFGTNLQSVQSQNTEISVCNSTGCSYFFEQSEV